MVWVLCMIREGPLRTQEQRVAFFRERGFDIRINNDNNITEKTSLFFLVQNITLESFMYEFNDKNIIEKTSLFFLLHDITFELFMHVFFGLQPVAHTVVIEKLLDEEEGVLKSLNLTGRVGSFRIIEALHFFLMDQFECIESFPNLTIMDIFDHQFPLRGIFKLVFILPRKVVHYYQH